MGALGALFAVFPLQISHLRQCTGCTGVHSPCARHPGSSIAGQQRQGLPCALLLRVTGDDMELPNSVQEIADVIGREAALYLIGQLPRTTRKDKNPKWRAGEQVMLYVPRKLTPDHRLVAILGMDRARQLVESFGGEILYPANCNGIHKRFVRAEVRRMANDNTPRELAQLMGVTERTIRNITRPVAANDNRTPANDA